MYDVVWTLVGLYAVPVTKYDEALAVDVVTADCQKGLQPIGHRYLQQQMENLELFHLTQVRSHRPLFSQLMRVAHLLHRY